MLVSILLRDMEMQSTLTALEYRRSRSFSDVAQRSLGLNVLKLETNGLVILITRTGINCQMSLPWSYLPWGA